MDNHSIHNAFIILHAASATISFFAGCCLILLPRYMVDQRLFHLYWWTLIGMVALLAGSIIVYWMKYTSAERIIFPGLFVLGLYMLFRARSAQYLLRSQPSDWKSTYVKDIGFTLISLFEGFVIVSGLNSGVPGALVALLAILGVLLGRWAIRIAQQKAKSP